MEKRQSTKSGAKKAAKKSQAVGMGIYFTIVKIGIQLSIIPLC